MNGSEAIRQTDPRDQPSALQPEGEIDDLSLMQKYVNQGDSEALGTLFRRHADSAYRTALRFTRNQADAEDAVQSAFIKIMRDAPGYRGGKGVRVWIMKIVASACRDSIKQSIRRRNREQIAVEERPPGERAIIF